MTSRLAERQFLVVPWSGLRSGGGDAAQVGSDLRMLLFAEGDADDGAYERLENQVEAQGHLFECAPGVVSVIAAAVADGTIPPANLAPTLDLLGRIVAGHSAPSETEWGLGDLREKCHAEAMKSYWALMRVACERDSFNAWRVAEAVLQALDSDRVNNFLRHRT
jgi:hypothetical protein